MKTIAIGYQEIIEKTIKLTGLNLIQNENFLNLNLIKECVMDNGLIKHLKEHGFKIKDDPYRGKILIYEKFHVENYFRLLLPPERQQKEQANIGLGVVIGIDKKNSCVNIESRVYSMYEMPEGPKKFDQQLFNVLAGYESRPLLTGKTIKELRRSGCSMITFNQLRIEGAKIIIPTEACLIN